MSMPAPYPLQLEFTPTATSPVGAPSCSGFSQSRTS